MQKLFEDWRKFVKEEEKLEEVWGGLRSIVNVGDKAIDTAQIAQGAAQTDDSLGAVDVGLGIGSLLAKTPVGVVTIALLSWVFGSTARANKEWNALPEDHPRKVAHRKHLARVKNAMDAQAKRTGLSKNIDVDAETGEAFDPTDMSNPIVKREWDRGMEKMKKVLSSDIKRMAKKNPDLVKDPKKIKAAKELEQWITGQ